MRGSMPLTPASEKSSPLTALAACIASASVAPAFLASTKARCMAPVARLVTAPSSLPLMNCKPAFTTRNASDLFMPVSAAKASAAALAPALVSRAVGLILPVVTNCCTALLPAAASSLGSIEPI